MLATRPGDGAALGLGVFLLFVYALIQKRVDLLALAATATGFVAVGAVTLVVLRLQLGKWFTTGYSLSGNYYTWAAPKFSLPLPNQFKFGIPLAVTAYTFCPAAAPCAAAGILACRAKSRPIAIALVVA